MLLGDYNPAGRLPVTFCKSVEQLPPFADCNMTGRTNRYFAGEPRFPFGLVLRYAKCEYRHLSTPAEIKAGDDIKISVEIRNTGGRAGDEVVQLYVKNLATSAPVPIRALQGFKRINLKPGEKRVVEFVLQPKQLACINERNQFVVEPGGFEIAVGGMLPETKSATTEILTKEIRITAAGYLVN
ncbi:fibronectin type III-like domain-contianing protein [candidate division KSB1 bacterium]|nr:fibronectin type III-like domain-contianing protein [candidate division KSB1 bacterium]